MPSDPITVSEPPPPPREAAPAEADVSRRDALTALGLAGAAVIAGGVVGHKMSHPTATQAVPLTSLAFAKPYVRGAEHFGRHEERWISTSCGQCTAGCGVRVRVVEGRAVRIEGNDKNPLNRGGIGPRPDAGPLCSSSRQTRSRYRRRLRQGPSWHRYRIARSCRAAVRPR